jgi:hypothetical protein
MIKISEILSKEGAIWINLSGSESKTLNHWKKNSLRKNLFQELM